jgi:hypothetical protein
MNFSFYYYLLVSTYSFVQKTAQEPLDPHQVMTGGQHLMLLLPMDPLTRMVTHLGLGPMVTVGGIATLPRMVMQAQAQNPAVGAHLTGCHPLHHSPLQLLSTRFGD